MYRKFILLLAILIIAGPLYGATIGSDTSVTRFNNQVFVNNGDRIAAFAALNAGFQLATSSVSAQFSSFFPVSGAVELNGGLLVLSNDLILQNVSTLFPTGTISGNGHQLELAAGISTIPSALEVGCAITLITSAAQPAQANETAWSPDSQYIVVCTNDAGGTATQVRVYSFNGTTLTLQGTGLDINATVNSVAWHPTNDWIAIGQNTGVTSQLYIYSFNRGTGALTSLSSAAIGGNVTSVAWHPSGSFLALGSAATGVRVRVYAVNGAGVLGSSVTVNPGATVNSVAWNVTGTFLAAGTNTGVTAQLFVYAFNSGALTLTLNTSATVGNQVNAVDWTITGTTGLIAVGVNAGTGRVRVYNHTGAVSLDLLAQAINSTVVNFVDWYPMSNCLSACLNSNSEGSGGEIRLYQFAGTSLVESNSQEFGTASVLGGKWSPNGNYFASASSTAASALTAFSVNTNTTNALFNNLFLYLNNDLIFTEGTITFTGTCMIDGNSSRLTLNSGTQIIVGSNSQLTFKDITLLNVDSGKLKNNDNTSSMVFDNVYMVLDGNYTFTFGNFVVRNQFILDGNGFTFNYATSLQSTVTSNSQFILQNGVTFNYAPTIASKTLLQLLDNTASIMINGATLATTTTGLQLTKGSLFIDGQSFLNNAGTVSAQGIEFGDGATVANNLYLEILPAANLVIQQGFVRDRNV